MGRNDVGEHRRRGVYDALVAQDNGISQGLAALSRLLVHFYRRDREVGNVDPDVHLTVEGDVVVVVADVGHVRDDRPWIQRGGDVHTVAHDDALA